MLEDRFTGVHHLTSRKPMVLSKCEVASTHLLSFILSDLMSQDVPHV